MKLYALAEPGGTVLKFQIYSGAGDDTSEVGHTQKKCRSYLKRNWIRDTVSIWTITITRMI